MKSIAKSGVSEDPSTVTGFPVPDRPIIAVHRRADNSAPHYHHGDIWELSHIVGGCGYYFSGSKVYSVGPGMFFFTDHNSIHWSRGSDIDRYTVLFSRRFLADRIESLGGADLNTLTIIAESSNVIPLPAEAAGTVERYFLSLVREVEREEPGYLGVVCGLLSAIITTCVRYIDGEKQEKRLGHRQKELIQGVMEYIDEHSRESIDLKVLADRAGVCQSYLSSLFNRIVGPLPAYIAGQRVSIARRLLETTELKIVAVAMESGFGDVSNFNRVFKRLTGVSPGVYRAFCREYEEPVVRVKE